MGFLGGNLPKPRRFNHQYIYVDERKERLQKMEEQAKRELGITPEKKEINPEDIRGKFVDNTVHLKRRKQKGTRPFAIGVILIVIVLLIFLWNIILTGEWTFSLF
ncbi:MAG: hypothetical protein ACRC9P_10660 [Bacteroides sp.]|mgnify:CR=1 FL=1